MTGQGVKKMLMARHLTSVFVMCAALYSCERKNTTTENSLKTSDTLPGEHIIDEANRAQVYKAPNDTTFRYSQRGNRYTLPPIRTATYLHAETFFEHVYPKPPSFNDSLLIFLKHYQKRLPDMGKYQAYTVRVDCYSDSTARCLCMPGDQSIFDFLVLYDTSLQRANVVNILYGILVDSETYDMNYQIDKKNTISMQEIAQIDGPDDEKGNITTEHVAGKKHKVYVTAEGTIAISSEQ